VTGASLNLDFHSVPYFGEHPLVESHYLSMRSRRQPSILTFLAQDAESQVFCYSNADIRKGEEAEEVMRFVAFWKRQHGSLPQHLVFDSKLTTYDRLDRLDASLPAGTDEIVAGVRYLSPDEVGDTPVDTDPEYVGLPTSYSQLPSEYNMNPTPGQTSQNPHVSFLNDIYKAPTGPLLKARLLSAAEVHFILAEGALNGWNVGDAKTHYEAAVEASLNKWGVGDKFDAYIAGPKVAFNNTLEQIIERWSIIGLKPGDFLAIGASMARKGDRMQSPVPLKVGSHIRVAAPALGELSHQIISPGGPER
jgi:hypothetical protein